MTFDALANPHTGEYGVLRRPATDAQAITVADLYAAPGATVPFEHIHPGSTETFTVVRGHLGLSVGGRKSEAGPGDRITVPAGTAHAWWNTGDETAWVVVEVDPGVRFEKLLRNVFLLAADGKTDEHGRPGLLQSALTAREFDDVHRLVRPPRLVQKLLFAALAPLARSRELRGSYPEYDERATEILGEIEAPPARHSHPAARRRPRRYRHHSTTRDPHRKDPEMTDHRTLWEHVRMRAEARRRHSTAQRKLHQQVTRIRRQARHDLRDARRRTATILAVASAGLTELATQALGRH